jgi:hypothetical protein
MEVEVDRKVVKSVCTEVKLTRSKNALKKKYEIALNVGELAQSLEVDKERQELSTSRARMTLR